MLEFVLWDRIVVVIVARLGAPSLDLHVRAPPSLRTQQADRQQACEREDKRGERNHPGERGLVWVDNANCTFYLQPYAMYETIDP